MSMKYLLSILLSLSASAVAGPAETGPLGPRYTDQLHGFSINPPMEAQVVRRSGSVEIVQFLVRNQEAEQIPIRMSLLQGSQKGQVAISLAEYGPSLAANLLAAQNFKADPALTESIPVAGRPALALAGPVGGEVFGLYRRDVWVQLKPGHFLVLRTTGPPEAEDRVVALSRASSDTLRLFDAEGVRASLEQDLARGAKLLADLTPAAIRKAVVGGDYWLAFIRDGQTVGFVHVTETAASQEGTDGVRIITESAWISPDKTLTLLRDESYAAFDRLLEQWEFFSADVDGGVERNRHHEFGLQQDRLLVVQTVVGPSETKAHTRQAPPGIYLPRTLGILAPRLIDRREPGRWAFAQYESATREVEMRTLTVKGPKAITLGGTSFQAVEMTDQMGLGAPVVTVLVDSAGLPLKIIRPDGSVLQQTTGAAIRARFKRELEMLQPAKPPSR